MKKYNKQHIFDYVLGNDIDEFEIEELEKNYQFMIDVIKYTNDKKIYNMCDDSVKKNAEFVKFILEQFKDDTNFILDVADYYMESATLENSNQDMLEISMLIHQYTRGLREERSLPYITSAQFFYPSFKLDFKKAIEKENIDNLGLGFCVILDEFDDSEIIIKYTAEEMLNEIFEESDDFNLEKQIHKRFKKVESLLKIGVKNYIMNVIAGYDEELSSYVKCHIELIDDIIKRINRIVKNWNWYQKNKINDMILEIENFLHKKDCCLLIDDVVEYISKTLKINELLSEYKMADYYDEEHYEPSDYEPEIIIDEEMNFTIFKEEDSELTLEKCGFRDFKLLTELTKRIKEIYDDEEPENEYIEQRGKAKIYKLNIKKGE